MMPARSIASATARQHCFSSGKSRLLIGRGSRSYAVNPAGSMDLGAAFVRHLVARRTIAIPEIVEPSVYPLEGRQVVPFAAELKEAH